MSEIMKVIMDQEQISASLDKMSDSIISVIPDQTDIAAIGIRSRGEIVAQRLAAVLSQKLKTEVPCGTLDITLYRDDINDPHGQSQPTVRSTEISFDINEKYIILVDDVLYTGRSTRAALDALIDLGRPKAIRLAVLVDRGHHELPIQADFVGKAVDIEPQQTVEVMLTETDGTDQVIVK